MASLTKSQEGPSGTKSKVAKILKGKCQLVNSMLLDVKEDNLCRPKPSSDWEEAWIFRENNEWTIKMGENLSL